MALINRLSRLFKADFHAVLDRIEEPEALLKQSVREMEEVLGRDQQRNRLLVQERGEILAKEKALAGELRELEEELSSCFDFDRDDLARTQIKRKLQLQRQRQFLDGRLEALESTLQRQQVRIEENASRLRAMRQKVELLATDEARATTRASGLSVEFPPQLGVSDEEVEVAFLREKQRRGQ